EPCITRAQAGQQSPRAAYVHVPFCRHRCGYCNFTLVTGRDDLVGDYIRAIEIELESTVGTAHQNSTHAAVIGIDPTSVATLYFGGGTPTHLKPHALRRLAHSVLQQHPLQPDCEWTVEANPADIDRKMIDTLADLGVTRLSLGGQS